jgi:hypothetical protein
MSPERGAVAAEVKDLDRSAIVISIVSSPLRK